MGNSKDEAVKGKDPAHMVGQVANLHNEPLRRVVLTAMRGSKTTAKEIAEAMGFDDERPVHMYLKGYIKVPVGRVEQLGQLLGIDLSVMLRLWLEEHNPELLAILDRLAEPPLLSMSERRMIEKVREFTTSVDAEILVNDATDLVAVVMVR